MSLSRPTVVILTALTGAKLALAHSIEVNCTVDPPDRVIVSVYFGMEPASGATVRVADPQGHDIAAGTANADGQYIFTVPHAAAYVFEATVAGHRARCRLDSEQVTALAQAPGGPPTVTVAHSEPGDRTVAEPELSAPNDHDHAGDVAYKRDLPAAHEHTTDFPTVELIAGLALILAVAAMSMTWSLRREFRAYLDRLGRSGG